MHATLTWVDQVRRVIPSAVVQSILQNVNVFMGNATMLVELASGIFNGHSGVSARSPEQTQLMLSVAGVVQKGTELFGSINATEFHSAFVTGQSAIQSFVRLSQSVDHQKVAKLVDSASDILGAADTEHIVAVISELSRGASELIRRFSRPGTGGGIRLSLPMEDLLSIKK